MPGDECLPIDPSGDTGGRRLARSAGRNAHRDRGPTGKHQGEREEAERMTSHRLERYTER